MKKCIISLVFTALHGIFYKQLQLLRVEVSKWPKIKHNCSVLSTVQAQIVPRLKQLRLKITSQQSTLLIAEY